MFCNANLITQFLVEFELDVIKNIFLVIMLVFKFKNQGNIKSDEEQFFLCSPNQGLSGKNH